MTRDYAFVESVSGNVARVHAIELASGREVWGFSNTDASGNAAMEMAFGGGHLVLSNRYFVRAFDIGSANRRPDATEDVVATMEDKPVTINVLGNDTDPDGDALTVATVAAPAHGSVTANANGTVTYTPTANYAGSDSFTYRVSDSRGAIDVATVTILVSPVNDPPEFFMTSSVILNEDAGPQSRIGHAFSVRPGAYNSYDEVGQSIAFQVTNTGSTGLAFTLAPAISADGTLTFTAAPDSFGTATFSVILGDDGGTADGGVNRSSPRTFSIVVNNINDAPTLDPIGDAILYEDDPTRTISLGGISPGPGEASLQTVTITATSSNLALIPNPVVTYAGPSSVGYLTFAPVANASGSATVTVRVSDNGGPIPGVSVFERTFTVNVVPLNDAPTATNDAYSVNQGSPLTVAGPGVLGNDSDADGDALSAILVQGPAHGVLALNPDGSFSYTPEAGYSGPDGFSYRAGDGRLQSEVASVTISVLPAASSAVRVVDNGDAGYSTTGSSWARWGGQGLKDDVDEATSPTDSATWTFAVTPGRHRVSATWTEFSNRQTRARFEVYSAGVLVGSKTLDQRLAPASFRDGGAWWEDLLAEASVAGSELTVRLTGLAGGNLNADAIRVERLG